MADNKLQLEIDDTDAKSKIQSLKAELAQLIQQAQQLKSALTDVTGGQKGMVQGALAGVMGRIGNIQSSLGTAQNSAGGSAAAIDARGGITGGFTPTLVMPQASQSIGIQPMNPGTMQGVFGEGGGSYVPTLRFPTGAYGGGGMGPPSFGSPAPGPSGFPTLPMGPGGVPAPTVQMGGVGGGVGGGAGTGSSQPPFSRYGVQMAGAAAYAAAQAGGAYFDYQTARIRTGGVDYMAQGGGVGMGLGSLAGGAIGGLLGSAFGPLGTLAGMGIGAGAGGGLGSSIGQWIMAPWQNKADAAVSLNQFMAPRFGTENIGAIDRFNEGTLSPPVGAFGGAMAYTPSRLERILGLVNQRYPSGNPLTSALPNVAATFGSVATTLFNYGTDPFGPGEQGVGFQYRPFEKAAALAHERGMQVAREGLAGTGGGSSLLRAYGYFGESDVLGSRRARGVTNENIAETYTRRLGLLFGKDSLDAAKAVVPAFDPFLGGNVADVLGAVGPTNALTFLRIQNPDLHSDVDPAVLSRVAGQTRMNARSLALAGLRPTQSGAAKEFTHIAQMAVLDQLPGGRNSLAYAQEDAGRRAGRAEHFQQDTLAGFGMRELQLQGEQRRQEYMPFAPGNIFATSIGIIANNRGQIGRLNRMLGNTDLSESERYNMESQRQGLMTDNARNVGLLSEGFENRLPALSAGRPAFFGRYNSMQGAAINLGAIGSPIRAYGAANGRQAAMQAAFVTGLGGDGIAGASMPYSRTGELNTTNDILSRILSAITAQNGGARVAGGRPMDHRNSTAAGQDSKQLPDPNHHPY